MAARNEVVLCLDEKPNLQALEAGAPPARCAAARSSIRSSTTSGTGP